MGCGGPGPERTITVPAFPIVAPMGGWGPDTIESSGMYLSNYHHEYFCEQTVIVRAYPNEACSHGEQDCMTSYDKVERVVSKSCVAAGTSFHVAHVRQIARGVVQDKGEREDPITGSCANGYMLGRRTAHPFTIEFDTSAACDAFHSMIDVDSITLDVQFETVSPDRIRFVTATEMK